MKPGLRSTDPFWRVPETRIVRPELWGLAILVVGMLLIEVWQSSRMTELCLQLDHSRSTLTQERSRVQYARVKLDRAWTRTQQEPLAARLGFLPLTGSQQIDLPAGYLAGDAETKTGIGAAAGTSRMAWLGRVTHALVPDATARSRTGS